MSDVLMLSAIVMLVLLFLKVPVYIAVLGGSMVYFVLNPDINAVYLPSRPSSVRRKSPLWPSRSLSVRVSS